MLETIRSQRAYQNCLDSIKVGTQTASLGLQRSARLPVAAALVTDLEVPILLLTDRADRALLMFDELNFWLPDLPRYYFPEPTPMFYEQAAWGSLTRRDRVLGLGALAQYHLPGRQRPEQPLVIVAPLRAVMTRTMPRRDFILASKSIRIGQRIDPQVLRREWVRLGYENVDVVVDFGQFSRRGGILDVWTPVERFHPGWSFLVTRSIRSGNSTQHPTHCPQSRQLLYPSSPGIPGSKRGCSDAADDALDEFQIPVLHPSPSTLLDYLTKDALILVD
jgi:transcription-repair coupling factor (superfamily II helicase)